MKRLGIAIKLLLIVLGISISISTEARNLYAEENILLNKSYTSSILPSLSYPDTNNTELTDGLYGSSAYYNPGWSGYIEQNPVFTFDLGANYDVIGAKARVFLDAASGIYLPLKIEIFSSSDGINFVRRGETANYTLIEGDANKGIYEFKLDGLTLGVERYLKIGFISNPGWWLFISEIEALGHSSRTINAPYTTSLTTNVSITVLINTLSDNPTNPASIDPNKLSSFIAQCNNMGINTVDLYVTDNGKVYYALSRLPNLYGLVQGIDLLKDVLPQLKNAGLKVNAVLISQLWGSNPSVIAQPLLQTDGRHYSMLADPQFSEGLIVSLVDELLDYDIDAIFYGEPYFDNINFHSKVTDPKREERLIRLYTAISDKIKERKPSLIHKIMLPCQYWLYQWYSFGAGKPDHGLDDIIKDVNFDILGVGAYSIWRDDEPWQDSLNKFKVMCALAKRLAVGKKSMVTIGLDPFGVYDRVIPVNCVIDQLQWAKQYGIDEIGIFDYSYLALYSDTDKQLIFDAIKNINTRYVVDTSAPDLEWLSTRTMSNQIDWHNYILDKVSQATQAAANKYIKIALDVDNTTLTKPGIPYLSSGTNPNNTGSYTISWSVSSDILVPAKPIKYDIWRNGLKVALIQTNSYSESNLNEGRYCYQVYALDDYGDMSEACGISAEIIVDKTSPLISNILVSNVTASSAAVSWNTSEPAKGRIEYGLTPAYGSSTLTDTDYLLNHTHNLTNLKDATLHHFRIISRDNANNEVTIGDYAFYTDISLTSTAFLKTQNASLYLNGARVRLIGANSYGILSGYLGIGYVTNTVANSAQRFIDAGTAHLKIMRFWLDVAPSDYWFTRAYGVYSRETDHNSYFVAFDKLIADAKTNGLLIVPVFVSAYDQWTKLGNGENFWTIGSATNLKFKEWVSSIVTRYKNEPQIAWWEIANEPNYFRTKGLSIATQDQMIIWAKDITAYIKSLDKNHLVGGGYNNTGLYEPTFDALNSFMDVATIHIYEQTISSLYPAYSTDKKAAINDYVKRFTDRSKNILGKPLVFGEFNGDLTDPANPFPDYFMEAVYNNNSDSALIWSWEEGYTSGDRYYVSPAKTPLVVQSLTKWSDIISDIVPPIAPGTPVLSSGTNPNNTGTFGLNWTVSTDTGSGLKGYDVYRNGAKVTQVTTNSYAETNLLEGSYTYYVIAVDNASNLSTLSGTSVAIVVDKTAPTITNISDSPDPFYVKKGQVSKISYTLGDNLSPSLDVYCYIYTSGGSLIKTLGPYIQGLGANSVTWDGKNSSGYYVRNATYKYQLKAIDKAGNSVASGVYYVTKR